MDVTATAMGIVVSKLILAYRTVTQDTCPHDAKVKMAGFEDRYECTRCQKIIKSHLTPRWLNIVRDAKFVLNNI